MYLSHYTTEDEAEKYYLDNPLQNLVLLPLVVQWFALRSRWEFASVDSL